MKYRLRVDVRHFDLEQAEPVVTSYYETEEAAVTMFRVLYRTRTFPRLHLFRDFDGDGETMVGGSELMIKSEDGFTTCYPVDGTSFVIEEGRD